MTNVNAIDIRVYPDPVLRQRARPITQKELGRDFDDVAHSMLELMHAARGIGLAANQIGQTRRFIVIGPTQEGEEDRVLINPAIKAGKGKMIEEEACLSVPGVNGKVRRFSEVLVEARNLQWEELVIEAEGLLARVLQHEIDHLEGRLFIDRLPPATKIQVEGVLKELEKLRGGEVKGK